MTNQPQNLKDASPETKRRIQKILKFSGMAAIAASILIYINKALVMDFMGFDNFTVTLLICMLLGVGVSDFIIAAVIFKTKERL